MSIDLYYVSLSAPCRAVLMTAKHLNIGVKIVNINLRTGEHLKPVFTQIPVISDQGFVLWESRAIMQYLCNEYAPNCSLYPKEVKERAVVDMLLNFSMTYNQALREALALKVIRGLEPTEQQIINYKNILKVFNSLIGDKKYVAGDDLTLADLALLSSSTILSINDFQDIEELHNLKAWYERLSKGLPYFEEVSGDVPNQYRELIKQKQAYYLQEEN